MNMNSLVAASALATALTGCFSHTVEVKPVEVKPVHITLDVNLKVDKELDSYFDPEKDAGEEPSSKAAAGSTPDAVDYSREAMIRRYKARKTVIADLKSRGVVGENSNGLLAFVTAKREQEAVVREENRDRNRLYEMIADRNGQTREVVASRAALRHAERARSGEYLLRDGGWQQKP